MTRPSTRCAIISSSVSRTSWMRGSLLAAVFMPCLQNLAALRSDDSANRVQFVGAEAVTSGQLDRFEPELAGTALPLHVYVRRFIAVEAREEEPIRPRDALDQARTRAQRPQSLPEPRGGAPAQLRAAVAAGRHGREDPQLPLPRPPAHIRQPFGDDPRGRPLHGPAGRRLEDTDHGAAIRPPES